MKVDTIEAPQTIGQRALGGHAAIGLIAGGLLYLVSLSGALLVVRDHWTRWEQPDVVEMQAIAPDAVQRAIGAVMARDAGRPPTTHLSVRLPGATFPRAIVTTDHGDLYIAPDGRIIGPATHRWTDFVANLHIYLHLPSTIGLVLVGMLGAMLASLLISGVIAHPRIFRDAFRLRARGPRQLARADWHNRLGVWTLPFGIAIALTGAFIGLATVGAGLIARSAYGGEIARVYAPIFGGETPPDKRAAPLPDVAAALRSLAAAFPDRTPTYVLLHDPGTAGQRVQILARPERRLIYGENHDFDARGRLTDVVGLSDGQAGQQVAASVYGIHFGDYGGIPIRLSYIAGGLALCAITGTGIALWLEKRRNRGRPGPRLEAMWTMLLWGAPMLIVAMAWAGGSGLPPAMMAGTFWTGLTIGMIAAAAFPGRFAPPVLRRGLAAMLFAAALLHFFRHFDAPPVLAVIDAILAGIAFVLLAIDAPAGVVTAARSRGRPRRSP
jgi:uncharacterized iron-regulated membrane protein